MPRTAADFRVKRAEIAERRQRKNAAAGDQQYKNLSPEDKEELDSLLKRMDELNEQGKRYIYLVSGSLASHLCGILKLYGFNVYKEQYSPVFQDSEHGAVVMDIIQHRLVISW